MIAAPSSQCSFAASSMFAPAAACVSSRTLHVCLFGMQARTPPTRRSHRAWRRRALKMTWRNDCGGFGIDVSCACCRTSGSSVHIKIGYPRFGCAAVTHNALRPARTTLLVQPYPRALVPTDTGSLSVWDGGGGDTIRAEDPEVRVVFI